MSFVILTFTFGFTVYLSWHCVWCEEVFKISPSSPHPPPPSHRYPLILHHLSKRPCFTCGNEVAHFHNNCGSVSGLSIPFLCSVYLSLCQYHKVLNSITLLSILIPDSVSPPAWWFFMIVLTLLGCLNYQIHLKSASQTKNSALLIGIMMNLCIEFAIGGELTYSQYWVL